MISGRQAVKLYSPAELAELFGVDERTVLEWRRLNAWPSVRVGRTIRFTQTQVDEILRRHSETPSSASPTAAEVVVAIPGQSKRSAARAARAS